ncbi:FbpB family small basic protein [Alteribacillus sp. HJP-4]
MKKKKLTLQELTQSIKEDILKDPEQLEKIDARLDEKHQSNNLPS